MLTNENIIRQVEALVAPLLAAQGAELVDLQFIRPRRGRATLRLFVDRPGGITLDELARLSRVVGQLLDVHDFIPGSYTLEVSSPGLTRELKKPQDYQRYVGRMVRITARGLLAGHQVHRGILKGLENEEICLQEGSELLRIPLKDIAKARLDIEMKNFSKEG
jgi:ribosome maturation factor RimP